MHSSFSHLQISHILINYFWQYFSSSISLIAAATAKLWLLTANSPTVPEGAILYPLYPRAGFVLRDRLSSRFYKYCFFKQWCLLTSVSVVYFICTNVFKVCAKELFLFYAIIVFIKWVLVLEKLLLLLSVVLLSSFLSTLWKILLLRWVVWI